MRIDIIPSVFAKNRKEFNLRLKKIAPISRKIQIDFMDGEFVEAKSVNLSVMKNLENYDNEFEAHLMVKNPEKLITKLKKKKFRKIIFHYESFEDDIKIINLIKLIRKNRIRVFIAVNPGTDIHKIIPFCGMVNGVLIMGHKPGVEKISLDKEIFDRVKDLKRHAEKINIQIDGGVDDKNINKLFESGARIFNVGSFVANSDEPKIRIEELKRAVFNGNNSR